MKNLLGAIAIAATGFLFAPGGAEAAAVVDGSSFAPLTQQGSLEQQVHWRPYFHCHRYRWRRYCHGGRPHWRHRRYRHRRYY